MDGEPPKIDRSMGSLEINNVSDTVLVLYKIVSVWGISCAVKRDPSPHHLRVMPHILYFRTKGTCGK